MQALETIARQNAAAVQAAIPQETAKGKFVVALYTGLNFIDYRSFDTQKDQLAFGSEYIGEAPGNRVEYHNPNAIPTTDSVSELPAVDA